MTTPIACRRAIASLLRQAQAGLRDARVLIDSGSPAGAALLQGIAASRMVAAVAASEFGWPDGAGSRGADSLDAAHPMKARLAALADRDGGVDLLPDGRMPVTPEDAVVRRTAVSADALLAEIASHFGVDFDRDEPARNATPIRQPDPAPEPRPTPEAEPEAEPDLPHAPVARPRPNRASVTKLDDHRHRVAPAHDKPAEPASAPIMFAPKPRPAGRPSEPSPMIEPTRPAAAGSSVSFWSLMDNWAVPDLDALTLIGHPGGLTKKRARPRFKLSSAEAGLLKLMRDIDGALTALDLKPATWLREPIAAAPFDGATPLAAAVGRGAEGVRDLSRYVFRQGLRLSLGPQP